MAEDWGPLDACYFCGYLPSRLYVAVEYQCPLCGEAPYLSLRDVIEHEAAQ